MIDRPSPRVVDLFRRTHARDPDRIRAGSAIQDWTALGLLAHTLRGAAGAIGASTVCRACTSLEDAVRRSFDGTELTTLAHELAGELRILLDHLDAEAAGMLPPPASIRKR